MTSSDTLSLRDDNGTEVDFFYSRDHGRPPHGYELRGPGCTNTSGRFATGMLEWDGHLLTGYDGTYELPVEVCDMLERLGYKLDEFIRPE